MTRTTSTAGQLSSNAIKQIIATIELVCKMLLALIPILKVLQGRDLPPKEK